MQDSLFSPILADDQDAPRQEIIELDQGRLEFHTRVLPEAQADALFLTLQAHLAWRQDEIRIQGRTLPVPRLQAWYGDPGTRYGYSGIQLDPLPWTPELDLIRARLQELCQASFNQASFNSVLCNLYRHGQDSVSWHADDEPELGINPLIASFSLGATRRFQLKPKRGRGQTLSLDLPHNSLLVMSGALQHHWIHQVPKTRQDVGPRINLTFRRVRHG